MATSQAGERMLNYDFMFCLETTDHTVLQSSDFHFYLKMQFFVMFKVNLKLSSEKYINYGK